MQIKVNIISVLFSFIVKISDKFSKFFGGEGMVFDNKAYFNCLGIYLRLFFKLWANQVE